MVNAVPFFEKPARERPPRRLLLLTYHFAPGNAVGALRWQKLSTLLHQHGWALDVISAGVEDHSRIDPVTAAELPPGIRIHRVPSPEAFLQKPERAAARLKQLLRRRGVAAGAEAGPLPQRETGITPADVTWNLLSARTYARLYFTLRDQLTNRTWTQRIQRLGSALVEKEKRSGGRYDAIVTSGPPHPWHNAGVSLSRRTGIPLVLDLRDPWSAVNVVHEYFATPLWLRLIQQQERRAVRQASLIVTNTPKLQSVMTQIHPAAADRMVTVMNGCDDDPLDTVPAPDSCFRIGYAGVIYLGRDPRPLFDGVAAAVRQIGLHPDQLKVELMGDVERYGGRPVVDIARESGIGEFVSIRGRADRRSALRFMSSCHVLVSLPWSDSMSIPAKIFEYMRFRAWLLVFARPDSALAELLDGSEADVISPDDVPAVAGAIQRRYRAFQRGERPPLFDQQGRFSRRRQAHILAAALNRLVEGRGA